MWSKITLIFSNLKFTYNKVVKNNCLFFKRGAERLLPKLEVAEGGGSRFFIITVFSNKIKR